VPVRWRKTRLSIRLVILRLLEMHTTSRVMQQVPQPFLIARDCEDLYYSSEATLLLETRIRIRRKLAVALLFQKFLPAHPFDKKLRPVRDRLGVGVTNTEPVPDARIDVQLRRYVQPR
jgi:hypothetical protein